MEGMCTNEALHFISLIVANNYTEGAIKGLATDSGDMPTAQ